MNYRRTILLALLLIILATHYILLGIYCSGAKRETKPGFIAQRYTYPFFHQNWDLFVKPPSSNYKLIATYSRAGQKQSVDLFGELVLKHQTNRLAGLEPVLIAFVNSIFYVVINQPQDDNSPHYFQNDQNYKIMEKVARGYFSSTRGYLPADFSLTLIVDDAGAHTRRLYQQQTS